MIRSMLLAAPAAFALLVGCGPSETANTSDNAAALDSEAMIEDVPSDGLAAPEGMPLDSESNSAGNTG